MRRLRRSEALRSMVRETAVTPADLILPQFVVPDSRPRVEIRSMPGVYQNRAGDVVEECRAAWRLGIRSVLLFGLPETKDAIGSSSWDPEGPVQSAIRAIKDAVPEMIVIADVCMCEYTDHGHCGVVVERGGVVDVANDETVDLLVRQSLSFAEAGADFVAPSDMMDGRVAAIRSALDRADRSDVGIIAYSAKFASAFYGPFRDAAESAPQFGDRRSYQMDPANGREALREIELDIEEGADMVMVKPALSYLDVIRSARDRFDLPIVAYNVSGEYSMVKAAAEKGWIDGGRVMDEILTSIRRAGADLIITYFAVEFAERYRVRT
ncbi:MAG TPA: porphobilinogen synthase [Thermoanaerobaculia bacterium]|nr:porphobilinogen synthase [Thermoanaerobaculia bacterium]